MNDDVVVLLHGLGRTQWSMAALWLAARRRGFRVINWHYTSTLGKVADHAAAFAREVAPRIADAPAVHFVTHSLGGIIVRQFLATHPMPNLGRVVMLAPPNGGSEIADRLQQSRMMSRCVVPLRELGTGATSTCQGLPAASYPVGVIAGSRSHIPFVWRWLNGPNDGVVAVERTRLAGMTGFIVLPRTHTTLPWSRDVIAQVFRFIQEGSFEKAA